MACNTHSLHQKTAGRQDFMTSVSQVIPGAQAAGTIVTTQHRQWCVASVEPLPSLAQPCHLQSLLPCEEVISRLWSTPGSHDISLTLPGALTVGQTLPLDQQAAHGTGTLKHDALNLQGNNNPNAAQYDHSR